MTFAGLYNERAAYAKINLTLNVIRKRPDGYHELETVMQAVSLCDDVSVRVTPRVSVERCPPFINIAVSYETDDEYIKTQFIPTDRRNTAYLAAEAFFDYQRPRVNERAIGAAYRGAGRVIYFVDIHIKKRIPAAAGLAGGSADAAAVLLALNDAAIGIGGEELLGFTAKNGESITVCADNIPGIRPLTEDEILAAALRVGADVPFCLLYGTEAISAPAVRALPAAPMARAAFAAGIGEKLRALPAPPQKKAVVIANPRMPLSTAQVFSDYIFPEPGVIENLSNLTRAMIKSHDGEWGLCFNALESAVALKCPGINRLKSALLESGASCAAMSGSGPTVYGLFDSLDKAGRAAEKIRSGGAWAVCCEFV
jgi:4-diphosphocytidyl-2-C-methyl-D-erythritol kinase